MDTSEQILVIFLSVALAVFLVLAIIATVLIIKLLQTIRRISEKAENIIEDVEQVGDTFRNAAGPLALLRVVSNIASVVNKHKK
jgi:hypothetical protein